VDNFAGALKLNTTIHSIEFNGIEASDENILPILDSLKGKQNIKGKIYFT
jgi:hypothetical protein